MSAFDRRLLYFILFYTCVEGLVINITFPSKIGFVAKDAACVLAYMSLFSTNAGRSFGSLSRLSVPIAVFVLIQSMYLALPSDFSLVGRLVGLKMRLLYIPIMFLGYRCIRNLEDLRAFVIVLIVISIPVSIFGIYLYFAGPGALVQIGGTYSAIVYSTTGVWRVPGTFTSPGQYGLYLTFNTVLAVGLLLTGGVGPRLRILLWTSMALMILAMLASGSRTPLLLSLACAGLTVVALGRVGRMMSMSVIIYAVFALAFVAFGAGVADRVDSIASTEHLVRFQQTYFGQLFLDKMMEEPMGLGLGAATLGARHFTEFREIVFVESYFGLVGIETGVLGLTALLWLCAAILVNLWRSRAVMTKAESAPLWYVVALFTAMVVALMPIGTQIDSPPGNAYFWLSIGICAKLYDLERWRMAAALQGNRQAQPLQPYGMPMPAASRVL